MMLQSYPGDRCRGTARRWSSLRPARTNSPNDLSISAVAPATGAAAELCLGDRSDESTIMSNATRSTISFRARTSSSERRGSAPRSGTSNYRAIFRTRPFVPSTSCCSSTRSSSSATRDISTMPSRSALPSSLASWCRIRRSARSRARRRSWNWIPAAAAAVPINGIPTSRSSTPIRKSRCCAALSSRPMAATRLVEHGGCLSRSAGAAAQARRRAVGRTQQRL